MWTLFDPNIDKTKLKRPKKHTVSSLYRDHTHTTIGGQGIITRLQKKNKKHKEKK